MRVPTYFLSFLFYYLVGGLFFMLAWNVFIAGLLRGPAIGYFVSIGVLFFFNMLRGRKNEKVK